MWGGHKENFRYIGNCIYQFKKENENLKKVLGMKASLLLSILYPYVEFDVYEINGRRGIEPNTVLNPFFKTVLNLLYT